MDFLNGALRDIPEPIIISKISVYGDGLAIEAPSSTENAEIVLQNTLEVFFSFGVREPVTPPLHYYLSTIVVDFHHSLNRCYEHGRQMIANLAVFFSTGERSCSIKPPTIQCPQFMPR
jgi:hypothetical protein